MSDVTLLRKLSFKSLMKYGKFHDLTVEEIIRYKDIKGLNYLTWIYYRSSKISFLPEVLLKLGIVEKNQIEKPGKISQAEYYKYKYSAIFHRIKAEDLTPKEKALRQGMNRKKANAIKKTKTLKREAYTTLFQKKEKNMYRNHGKYSKNGGLI